MGPPKFTSGSAVAEGRACQ